MIRRMIIVAIAAVGLSGCATIVQGSTQTVSVNTRPEDGAKCELKNSQGTWYLTSPGSVTVHKTKTDLQISCRKDGVGKGSAIAKATFGGTTFGNVIAGGLIGVAVDAASGANFYYPSPVLVTLTADGAPVVPPAASVATPAATVPPPAATPAAATPAATPAAVTPATPATAPAAAPAAPAPKDVVPEKPAPVTK